ncbi:MAG: type IV secretion system DNA-binding domain-containing protein [gamma proteobacterium symbiont of Ctena orbiculata]
MNSKWQPPRPSAYTPFFRRFTDERARELSDSKQLFSEVTKQYLASGWADNSAFSALQEELQPQVEELDGIPDSLKGSFTKFYATLLSKEKYLYQIEEVNWNKLTIDEQVKIREQLRTQQYFLSHETECTEKLIETITNYMVGIADNLVITDSPNPLFTVPLFSLLKDTNETIEAIYATLANQEFIKLGLFEDIGRQLYLNLAHASGIVPDTEQKKPFVYPSEKRLPPKESIETYLQHTPFYDLLSSPAPFTIPDKSYFEHMHVIGGTGAGKTTWLAQLILHHIHDPRQPSVVVVDSQGALIPPLSTLASIQDRLIYIDPHNPLAINVFDTQAGALETFDYLFSGIVGTDLTAKQSILFEFLAKLMLSIPNATLQDLLNLTIDTAPYEEAIRNLPITQRQFFEVDFNSGTFRSTREQVRYRLQAIMGDDTLHSLLANPKTELNIGEALNSGSIILIDTSKDVLKKASAPFGRIFIALILQALYERTPIPESKRHPTHLIVDEAHEYFDQNINALLNQVRKYRCGCVFAHQLLNQASPDLRASLASSTSIKMASGISIADARVLAPDFRATPDFMLDQPVGHFATYIKNVTQQAVSIEVKPGLLEREKHVKERPQKKRATTPKQPSLPENDTKASSQDEIDTDASESW